MSPDFDSDSVKSFQVVFPLENWINTGQTSGSYLYEGHFTQMRFEVKL